MTLGEFREFTEDLDDETEIRLAMQPNWPFEYSVSQQLAIVENEDEGAQILYLAERKQLGYLPEEIRDELGW